MTTLCPNRCTGCDCVLTFGKRILEVSKLEHFDGGAVKLQLNVSVRDISLLCRGEISDELRSRVVEKCKWWAESTKDCEAWVDEGHD